MTRADKLRGARNRAAVAWRNFQVGFKKDPTRLYCFFEGDEDARYYGIRIDLLVLGSKRQNLPCKGKKGVLHLLKLVSGDDKYEKAWVAFFVDKDFDDKKDL